MLENKCNECGEMYSTELAACPNCGCPNPMLKTSKKIGGRLKDLSRKKKAIIVAVLVVLLALIIVLIPNKYEKSALKAISAYKASMKDASSFKLHGIEIYEGVDKQELNKMIHSDDFDDDEKIDSLEYLVNQYDKKALVVLDASGKNSFGALDRAKCVISPTGPNKSYVYIGNVDDEEIDFGMPYVMKIVENHDNKIHLWKMKILSIFC